MVALSNPHQILASSTLTGSNPRIGYLCQVGRSSNSLTRLQSPDDSTSYRSNNSGANDEASKPLSRWWTKVIPAIKARLSLRFRAASKYDAPPHLGRVCYDRVLVETLDACNAATNRSLPPARNPTFITATWKAFPRARFTHSTKPTPQSDR